MNQNIDVDIDMRDTLILKTLSSEINGLGYNELIRQTGFNKKTLTSHLKKLEENNLITKQKLGEKQNSATFYKTQLNPNIKNLVEQGFLLNSGMIAGDYDFDELGKISAISAIPYMLLGITTSYWQFILEYLTGSYTKMELQFISKFLIEFIEEWKSNIDKKLDKKNLTHLLDHGLTIHSSEIDRISWMISDSMERKKLRTSYEIKIASDTISPFRVYWANGNVKQKKISELIKDPTEQKKYEKIEKEYLCTLSKLIPLQRKLIGRFPDGVLQEFEKTDNSMFLTFKQKNYDKT